MDYAEYLALPDAVKNLLAVKYDQLARDEKVIAMWNKGKNLREVGEKFDLSHEGVRVILKRHGINTKRSK